MSEFGLFIFWENARFCEQSYLRELTDTFDVVSNFTIKWSDRKLLENMSRFYGLKRRYALKKLEHCGGGAFNVVIVRDHNPRYLLRNTLAGRRKVNANIYDKKIKFRQIAGGGHKIHASDNEAEAIANYAFLLGDDLLNNANLIKTNGKIFCKNLQGCDGWQNLRSFLLVMNTNLNYVILRNFESFPDDFYVDQHADIDILIQDRKRSIKTLNARKKHLAPFREAYEVVISGIKVNLDIRTVNSGYYCEKWSTKLFSERIFDTEKYCYRLPTTEYKYSLIYHALFHKERISADYMEKIKNLDTNTVGFPVTVAELENILSKYMAENNLKVCEPADLSVFFSQRNTSFRRKFYFNFFKYGSLFKRKIFK